MQAYLFKNSELGYCQAMNILAAAVVMWDDFSGLIRVLVLLKHKDHTTVSLTLLSPSFSVVVLPSHDSGGMSMIVLLTYQYRHFHLA